MNSNASNQKHSKIVFLNVIEKYGFIILLLSASIIFGIFNPKFLTLQNFTNISIQVVPIGIIALGAMFVIISGGLDLSAGVGVSISAVVIEAVFRPTHNIVYALLASFTVAILIGVLNGLLISKVKLPSVIVTLIMMTIIYGMVYIIVRLGQTIDLSNKLFSVISNNKIIGIPVSFLIMIFVYFIGYLVLNHTKFGFHLVAIGNNPEGARAAGINVNKYIFYPYLISGFFMGLAALIISARVVFVSPGLGGTNLLLDAIAAVIIGGVSISGGKGTIRGVFLGSIAIAIINNMVNILNIKAEWNQFFKGMVIVVMMLVNRYIETLEENK